MKKFKFIFFVYLVILVSLTFYLDTTDNLSLKLVDAVHTGDDIQQAVKLEKAVLDLGMTSEEDVTTKIFNDDTIKFNTTMLSNNNDKATMNLKLSNNYSDKKIDVGIKCSSTSDYISVYPDKNNYTIDKNEDVEVLITVQLNKRDISGNANVDFQCKVVSIVV